MFTGKNLKDSVIEGKYYHLKEEKDMQICKKPDRLAC